MFTLLIGIDILTISLDGVSLIDSFYLDIGI